MTIDELFDLVAPIAIMHYADVCYEEKARAAIQKLKAAQEDPEVLKRFASKQGTYHEGWDWDDYMQWSEPSMLRDIRDIYNPLFEEIVDEECPGNTVETDEWGAPEFRDANGVRIFAGDGMYECPWYETAQLLRERLREHKRTAACHES